MNAFGEPRSNEGLSGWLEELDTRSHELLEQLNALEEEQQYVISQLRYVLPAGGGHASSARGASVEFLMRSRTEIFWQNTPIGRRGRTGMGKSRNTPWLTTRNPFGYEQTNSISFAKK